MFIMTEDRVDNMVGSLRLVRVAHTPVFDVLKVDEAFLDAELALIRLILFVVAKQVHIGGRCTSHLRHAQTDSIWANVACTEQHLMVVLF